MTTEGKLPAAIFVNRSSQQWVVRDPDGNFWTVPPADRPWEHRQPLELPDALALEPVPGHYKDMLGVPF